MGKLALSWHRASHVVHSLDPTRGRGFETVRVHSENKRVPASEVIVGRHVFFSRLSGASEQCFEAMLFLGLKRVPEHRFQSAHH